MSTPNPVARIEGAPAPPTAGPSPSRPAGAGGVAGLSRNQLYAGAAVLVAAFAALSAWRGKKNDSGDDNTVTYEMDTSLTDFQSQLEQIGDDLDQIKNTPRPAPPTPVVPTPAKPPPPAPKATTPRPTPRPVVESLVPGKATVRVTSSPGATSYVWTLNGKVVNSTPGPKVTLTQLAKGRKYQVAAAAQNTGGRSKLSGGTTFTAK